MTNRRSHSVLGTTELVRHFGWFVPKGNQSGEPGNYWVIHSHSEGQEAKRLHNLFDQCMFYVSVDCGDLGGMALLKASTLTSNFI